MRPWPRVSEVSARIMTGASAGLTLRYSGLLRRSVGMSARAALIAACTSRAAPSMSRDRSNCRVMRELPTVLVDVISETPAMAPSRRSSGVVTLVATVSGEAPGSDADTEIVGKSTLGNGATGNLVNAMPPASRTPKVSKVVATGRAMKGADRFTAGSPPAVRWTAARWARATDRPAYRAARHAHGGRDGRRRDRSPAW